MGKRIMAILLASTMAVGMTATSYATQTPINEVVSIDEAIENYFELRESSLNNPEAISRSNKVMNSSVELSESVIDDEINRQQQIISKMQERDNIYVVNATTTPRITETSIMENGNVEASVYEWTWIEYNATGNGPATDELGYATMHNITLVPTEQGYKIDSDIYFEGNTTGAISSGYNGTEYIETNVSTTLASSLTNRSVGSTYSPSDASDYADEYVQNTANTVIGQNTDYYNLDEYGYISWNDCANYVSQCLYAGGLEETADWYYDRPYNGGSVADYCPSAWRLVSSLVNYLSNQGYSVVNATKNNVEEGNPVYVSGHITICVGENSSGTPIINGHTKDMYHCPWTWVSNDGLGTNAKNILIG